VCVDGRSTTKSRRRPPRRCTADLAVPVWPAPTWHRATTSTDCTATRRRRYGDMTTTTTATSTTTRTTLTSIVRVMVVIIWAALCPDKKDDHCCKVTLSPPRVCFSLISPERTAVFYRSIYFASARLRGIEISTTVCLCLYVFFCPLAYLKIPMSKLHKTSQNFLCTSTC